MLADMTDTSLHTPPQSGPETRESATPTQVFTGGLRPFPGLYLGADEGRLTFAQKMDMCMVIEDVEHCGLPLRKSVSADFEDFWEDAYRVSAALRACEDAGLTLRVAGGDEIPNCDVRLGPVGAFEEGAHCGDPLIMPAALIAHGNRLMARAWVDTSEDFVNGKCDPSAPFEELGASIADGPCPSDFYGSLLWLWHSGARRAVVKCADRKTGVSVINLSPHLSRLREATLRDDVLCWISTPDAAPASGFLVQEWVPMAYEYRFFIVDGRAIAGAGCIEEFTPLNRLSDDVFDPQIRRLRGNGIAALKSTAVKIRPEVVARYKDFIEPIARALPEGERTVVVDVAMNPRNGKPLIVELNALPNSGLYASDVHAVYRALVGAADRGYTRGGLDRALVEC